MSKEIDKIRAAAEKAKIARMKFTTDPTTIIAMCDALDAKDDALEKIAVNSHENGLFTVRNIAVEALKGT